MNYKVTYPFTVTNMPNKKVKTIGVGIDPSTRMICWSVVDENGSLLYAESIKVQTKANTHEDGILSTMVALSDVVFPHIYSVVEKIPHDKMLFGIEHFTYAYSGTKQKTIVALSSINYFMQYLVSQN